MNTYYSFRRRGKAGRAGASALAAALAWGAVAAAQEAPPGPPVEPSKLFTQDAVPVGGGVWQAQTHVSFLAVRRRWEGDGHKVRRGRCREGSIEAALNYGLTDDLDVGFGSGFFWLKDEDGDPDSGRGLGDLALAAKWRFLDAREHGSAVALAPAVIAPVGEEGDEDEMGPGLSCWSAEARLAVTREWPGGWTASADLGYRAALGGEDDRRGTLSADVAVGFQVLAWLQPEVEINYAFHFHREMPDGHGIALSAGLVLSPADWVTVRIGLQRRILGENEEEATVGRLSVDGYF